MDTTNGTNERIWSAQQKDIFDEFRTGRNNLVVRARAGTGKTTTIIHGVQYAPEQRIVMLAFNKKIAEELKSKLKNPRAEAKTTHSVGFGLCLSNWKGVRLDDGRAERLARQATGHRAPDFVVNYVKRLASLGKNACPFPRPGDLEGLAYDFDLIPDQDDGEWNATTIAAAAQRAMDLAAQKDGTVDFDDMIFVPVRNGWLRGKYDLVIVDEAQDMNVTQLLLAQGICKKGGRIVVVGDDRQAIYAFRGADSNSLDRLKSELRAKELGLTITYRCPKNVVALAKTLVPDYTAADSAPEGLVDRLEFSKLYENVKLGDFVLSRKNAPLVTVCLSLLRRNVRCMIEGRDIGANLVAIVRKVKGRSIPDFLERLDSYQKRQADRINRANRPNKEQKLDALADQCETLRTLAMDLTGLKELEARIGSLFAETPAGKKDFVLCSSVHRAKGLETDHVFVLEETLYPGGRTWVAEEQNIHYVAVTRAKAHLTMVSGIN